MKVYFDNASTTPLLPEVKETMHEVIQDYFGNPSSIHHFGRKSKTLIEDARKTLAEGMNASTGEIFFTSGATEANNMALISAVRDLGVKRIISSPTEHHCVIHTLDYVKEQFGTEVSYLNVDNFGSISIPQLEDEIDASQEKTLVSLMHGNNEIGTLHQVDLISVVCKEHGVLFHCDMAQTITKYPLDLNTSCFSFISGSAHKFFGPKGVGFIYINNDNLIRPLMFGGDQERGMRSGTENLYGIAGMAKAFQIGLKDMQVRKQYVGELATYMCKKLKAELTDIRINGNPDQSLYNIISVSFPPSPKAPLLMMNLDIAGISASAGSACSSGVESDSHVLKAIGHDTGRKTVRFSLSHFNTREEVDYVVEKLKKLTPVPHA